MDYYNSFVIHPMLLDILEIMQKHNKGETDLYKKEQLRFSRYAEQQERMISPDGAYPVIGRSIAYRFGTFHVLSTAALKDLLPTIAFIPLFEPHNGILYGMHITFTSHKSDAA